MPASVLHVGASIKCSHQASVSVITSNTRVLVGGRAVATRSDTCTVSGCPFQAGQKKQPCVTVTWTSGATRVRVNGQIPLLRTSTGICRTAEQITQGAPVVTSSQTRVSAT